MIRRASYSKYRNQRTDGFSSKLEAQVYRILQFKEKAGLIKYLRCQHPVELTLAKIGCKIDFAFEENDVLCFAEAKGCETDRWRIIRKLWGVYGPGKLYIYKGSHVCPSLTEIIEPQQRRSKC